MIYKGETYDKTRLIIDIVISSISFVLFILSAGAIYKYSTKDRILDGILENWESNLIYDIDITETTGACAADYKQFFIDKFQGTKEGCNCLGRSGNSISKKISDRVNPFPCTYDLLDSNCYKVLPISPKTIKLWQTKYFCIKKENSTYYDHIRSSVKNKDDCQTGYTQCGQIDSLHNKLCLLGNTCPINKVVTSSFREPIDYAYQKRKLTQNHYLYFTTLGNNETIPIDFAFSEGNMCIDPNEKNSQFVPYVLINEKKNYYCSFYNETIKYDDRYIKLDSMVTSEFLDQNGLLTPLLDLPHYPKEQLDSVISIFARTYIGWNINCLANSSTSPESLRNVTLAIKQVYQVNIGLFVIVTISFVYLLPIVLFYKRVNPNHLFYLNLTSSISIGLFIIIFALSIYAFSVINAIDLNIFSCGDTLTTLYFAELHSKLLYTKIIYLILAISVMSFSVAYFTVFFIGLINYRKNPQQFDKKAINNNPSDDLTRGVPNHNEKDEKNFVVKYPNNSFAVGNKGGIEEEEDLKEHKYDSRNKPRIGNLIGSKFRKGDPDDKWGDKSEPKDDQNIVEYK